jgi:hypothetical protein
MTSYQEAMRQARNNARTSEDWTRLAREIRESGLQPTPSETPAYVHRLLDAYINEAPIDFKGASVPADIQRRIETEVGQEWRDVAATEPVEPAPDTGEQLVNLAGYVERVNAAEADIAQAQRPECEVCGGALRVEVDQVSTGSNTASYVPGMRRYLHVTLPENGHLAVPKRTERPGDVGGETTAILPAVRINGMVEEARTEIIERGHLARLCMHCGGIIGQSADGGVDWIHTRTGQRVCATGRPVEREGTLHTFAWPAAVTEAER